MKPLQLEINPTGVPHDEGVDSCAKRGILITPPVGREDFWLFRVKLSDNQAIVGFPKFNTVGIGFQKEKENWNTNLPFSCSTERIFNHIKKNKGSKSIRKSDCMQAIQMIREAASKHLKKDLQKEEDRMEALGD